MPKFLIPCWFTLNLSLAVATAITFIAVGDPPIVERSVVVLVISTFALSVLWAIN
jgi:hypothetical protein